MAKKKNKFVSAFEQFGRSFLLPVSVLPGAGIIKGIGTAFSNSNTLKMFPVLKKWHYSIYYEIPNCIRRYSIQ